MASEEHFAKLEEGVEAWNIWRLENPEVRPDLSFASLKGVNFSGANLTGVSFFGANLRYAVLQEADLSGANLTRAYLIDANLTGANLTEADLREAHLFGANFEGANLYKALLPNPFKGARISGKELDKHLEVIRESVNLLEDKAEVEG